MPDDQINKRMNYFDRQFLRAADFQVEQKYHIDRHRRHNRLLHTPGIAGPNDLLVNGAEGQAQVTVSGGSAIDDQGREIVLPVSPPPLDLSEIPEAGTYAIYLELEEEPTDPSTDPGVEGPTRITETPKFRFQKLVTDPPKYPTLTLAAITVDEDKTLTDKPDISMRTLAGTSSGFTGTFAAITASSLTLPHERQPPVQIENSGFMRSPMWQVRLSLNAKSTRLVAANQPILTPPTAHTAQFDSLGGTLLIFASISVLPVPPGNIGFDDDFIVGVNILLDNIKIPDPNNQAPSVPGCARKTGVSASGPLITPHMTVTNTLAISNIGKKIGHTLLLRTADNTTLRENDFYSVTILELPF
jgi:hypothetical protein